MTSTLEADYLVVGAGTMGMAFVDTLVAESNASVVLVDRHHRPGGHWNDAYSFVRLHQPSAIYGVPSMHLGRDALDAEGLNSGLYELASGAEICSYFDQVMQQRLLPSGRVRYFPACSYRGEERFVAALSGAEFHVQVRKAVVDATYTNTQVPSTHARGFVVDEEVRCIAINELVHVTEKPAGYVILGGGKTSIDAVLWLLERGVEPSDICWIRPRDAWLLNRRFTQPGTLVKSTLEGVALQTEACAAATSVDDLYARLLATRQMLCIDELHTPSMYHCATVTEAELMQLRRVKNVVRLGRVTHIERDRIVLQRGSIASSPDHLHIDCTASGIRKRPAVPVFAPQQITLQAVRQCQPAFSAAMTAHVELSYQGEEAKNQLCVPIPYPEQPIDWLRGMLATRTADFHAKQDKELRTWVDSCRLNYGRAVAEQAALDPAVAQLGQRFRDSIGAAMSNLAKLLRAVE